MGTILNGCGGLMGQGPHSDNNVFVTAKGNSYSNGDQTSWPNVPVVPNSDKFYDQNASSSPAPPPVPTNAGARL
jgi:hypothetical protein